MTINIIIGYKVSTRPCEFDNFFRLLGHTTNISTRDKEYGSLMNYLTKTGRNLTDFLELDEEDYNKLRTKICVGIKSTPIFNGIDKCRTLRGKPGYNLLVYLLYRLKNRVLKAQYDYRPNDRLSNLYFKYKCIPFDNMPFANNPVEHTAILYDLYDCISPAGREHELLARTIINNTEINGKLYTPVRELSRFNDLDNLIAIYNSNLYWKHREGSSLKLENGFVFISGYENDSAYITERLLFLSTESVVGYTDSVKDWLNKSAYVIDDESKKCALQDMFAHSKVSLIYGSAGTGKSTMIKLISHFFRDKIKIYLANTNAAVENLKRKIGISGNTQYYTTASFLNADIDKTCDILFIDECSTVSNRDMKNVLQEASFKLLVLVGDVFQIESIRFGNWFYIAKMCIPQHAVFELTYVHRSAEHKLLSLWDSVRKLDDKVADIMELHHFCSSMNDTIFDKMEDDEIVLCLNYDGLYGINNLNKFLQDNNREKAIKIGFEQYKEGDPVIFKENNRFKEYLYNNLKGSIISIDEEENKIKFTVEVNTVFNSVDVEKAPFNLEQPLHSDKSVISFYVERYENTDDDDKNDYNIVPFQVAYAVSIHKAQGLEYDSVKIVITDEIEELISHNIFYTAITRAKKMLRIYWTKRTEQHIIDDMHVMFNKEDAVILLKKLKLKAEK